MAGTLRGSGLVPMAERAQRLGGSVHIDAV